MASLVVMMGTGVCRNKGGIKWRAKISIDRKQINLGAFEDETEAAKVSGIRCSSTISYHHHCHPFCPLVLSPLLPLTYGHHLSVL